MKKIIAIAIDKYEDKTISNLANCVKDTNKLIDVLFRRYQFNSYDLYSQKEQTTLSFLYNQLYSELINSLEKDEILIIFAGHGEYIPALESNYWLCSDSKKNDLTTWFNIGDLIKFFKASPAKNIALISDSCFSGAIFQLNRGGGLKALQNKYSRQAITSGGIETVSDGKEGENSPFCNAVFSILESNNQKHLSFNHFSEQVILQFNEDRTQTPSYGSLAGSGDKGGTFFFELKNNNETSIVKTIQLPLEINKDIKIENTFEIPFFIENKKFNNDFVNAFVQQLGYSIINNIRVFVNENENYSISRSNENEFYLDVNYTIETLNDDFLSIVITESDYFGSAHPNYYVYSINFALQPERKISLFEIIDHSDYENIELFLIAMINQYSDTECTSILLEFCKYEYLHDLGFSFNSEIFTIYFINLLPHVAKGCGILNIPIDKIKLKV